MIKLQKDKVALIPIRDPDKIGSLYIPEIAKERVDQGLIKYVGPECKFAKIGMFVIFTGFAGQLVNIEDPDTRENETLIVMKEEGLIAELQDLPTTEVSGLYFRGVDGEYFPATYEMSMSLIARSFQEAAWRQWMPESKQGINVVTPRPTQEEIERYGRS